MADSQHLKIEHVPVRLDGPGAVRIINQGPDPLLIDDEPLGLGTRLCPHGVTVVSQGRSRVLVQHLDATAELIARLQERIRELEDG